MTTLPSGNWMESLTDASAYLVIFSDDGRTGASNQSYLGKVMVVLHSVEVMGPKGQFKLSECFKLNEPAICEKAVDSNTL